MADDGLVEASMQRISAHSPDIPEVLVIRNGSSPNPDGFPNTDDVSSPPAGSPVMIGENDAMVLSNPSLVPELQDAVKLTWEDVCVEVELPKPSLLKRCFQKNEIESKPRRKQILFNVTGELEPGTLLAVMGSSGAGKTTLMNTLAHQNIGPLFISGSVKVNGKDVGKRIKSISAYVQQEDLFIGTLTVREHLMFQAMLRIDKSVPKKEKIAKADRVIAELGLTKCKDTMIGIPGRLRGISGGELKRLSFASEILTNPALLFVDEPTSGLDSFMAQSVVAALQKMAAEGRTILSTIHQPSSEVYNMFNKVLFMSEGSVAFIGKAPSALPFFSNLGFPCPTNFNPADHFINTLAIVPGQTAERMERSKRICKAFDDYASIHHKPNHDYVLGSIETATDRPSYKVGFLQQIGSVLWRASMSNKREPFVSTIKTVQIIVIALIVGLIYLRQDNSQSSIQNISGAIFFCITTSSFNSLTSALFVFPAELPVFLKEHKLGMYRVDVYFISKTLAELPYYVTGPFIFCTIAYWMIGLAATAEKFFLFACIIILINQAALSFGYLISTISPSVQVASALGAPMMMPFLLFGGFFLKDDSVPPYFIWLKYLSWFKYSFEALLVNQWESFGQIGNGCPKATINSTAAVFACIPDGNAVIKFYSLDADRFGFDIGMLVVLTLGFRLLAFVCLFIKAARR